MASNFGLAGLIIAASVLAISAEIVRPCRPLTDACVAKFLNNKTGCSLKLPNQAELDPYHVEHFYFETPYFNITEDRYNVTVTGLNTSSVHEFFYNTETHRAVMTISVPDLEFKGHTVLHYRQFAKEPLDISTNYKVHFNDMYLNTIFNDFDKMSLLDSVSYPTIPKWPTFDNGQELADAAMNDTRVAFLVSEYDRVPMVATLEAFQYRAPALVHLFTQYKLCHYNTTH